MMKKLFFFFAILLALSSCGKKGEVNSLQDSLLVENERLNQFLDIVAFNMDSINGQEHYLYRDREGNLLSNKEQIRDNLKLFKYTLDAQRKRIAQLEQQLEQRSDARSKKLLGIIRGMEVQLNEKDSMISQLNIQLKQKNLDIATLNTRVQTLTTDVSNLTEEVAGLTTLNEQTTEKLETANQKAAEMSVGYVLVGTKSTLSKLGVLKGGFLKKKKADLSSAASNEHFQQVDIRNYDMMRVPGNDVKVMSPQPASSYSLEQSGGETFLRITNSSAFWGASRYLIIQYK